MTKAKAELLYLELIRCARLSSENEITNALAKWFSDHVKEFGQHFHQSPQELEHIKGNEEDYLKHKHKHVAYKIGESMMENKAISSEEIYNGFNSHGKTTEFIAHVLV